MGLLSGGSIPQTGALAFLLKTLNVRVYCMGKEVITVMIVDQCEDDRFLLQRSLRTHPQLKVIGELDRVNALIDYLSGKEPFADRNRHPIPDVLLVDALLPEAGTVQIFRE